MDVGKTCYALYSQIFPYVKQLHYSSEWQKGSLSVENEVFEIAALIPTGSQKRNTISIGSVQIDPKPPQRVSQSQIRKITFIMHGSHHLELHGRILTYKRSKSSESIPW